ncbi:hypothetical protein AOLI_G00302480 [Acnodon oligacanthus]
MSGLSVLEPQSHEGPEFSSAKPGCSGSLVDEAFTQRQLESDEALISVKRRRTVAFLSAQGPEGQSDRAGWKTTMAAVFLWAGSDGTEAQNEAEVSAKSPHSH